MRTVIAALEHTQPVIPPRARQIDAAIRDALGGGEPAVLKAEALGLRKPMRRGGGIPRAAYLI